MSQFKLAWSRFRKSWWSPVVLDLILCLFYFCFYAFSYFTSSSVDFSSDSYFVGFTAGMFLFSLLTFSVSLFFKLFKRRLADQED